MVEAPAPLPRTAAAPERGRVLVFAPHADDELFGCGGTLCLHAEQGDPVRVVVAFDGVAGLAQPAGAGARGRRAEALEGARAIGTSDYVFWAEPEGHRPSAAERERGIELALEELTAFRPDLVYLPWSGEHHLDHHVLASVVEEALARASWPLRAWAYEVWTPLVPELVVDISRVARRKARGLAAHASQSHTPLVRAALGLGAQRALYLDKGARYGEAFRRVA